MKRIGVPLPLSLAAGIAVGVIGSQRLNAQQPPLKATEVLRADVVGMEGKEVILEVVEIGRGARTGKHLHPGHEAFYVLEGSGVLELEGLPPTFAKRGDAGYIPARQVHEGKNASATEPPRLMVFRIHEKGQPMTVRGQ